MTATMEAPVGLGIPDDANEPTQAVVRYSVTDAAITKLKNDFGSLIISDSKSEAAVRSALTTLVRTRTGIEAEYKALTADANERIKLIRSEKNRIISELAPTESHLQGEWDRVQAEKARKKAEAEAAAKKEIQDKIDAANAIRKAELDRQAEENRKAAEAIAADKKRIEEEQAAAKLKADEEARVQRERDEQARIERQRIEDAEREKQRQADAAADQARRDELAKQEAEAKTEREKFLAMQKAVSEEIERKRREVEAEAARLKAEKDAKDLADRLVKETEENRIKDLERQAELKRRENELRPDRQKVMAWAKQLRDIDTVSVKSDEAKEAVEAAHEAILGIANDLESFASGKIAA